MNSVCRKNCFMTWIIMDTSVSVHLPRCRDFVICICCSREQLNFYCWIRTPYANFNLVHAYSLDDVFVDNEIKEMKLFHSSTISQEHTGRIFMCVCLIRHRITECVYMRLVVGYQRTAKDAILENVVEFRQLIWMMWKTRFFFWPGVLRGSCNLEPKSGVLTRCVSEWVV